MPLTAFGHSCGEKVLSKGVRYVIHMKPADAKGKIEWKNAFALRSGIISDAICGYNAVREAVCGSAHDLQKNLQDSFNIPDTDVIVEEIEGFIADDDTGTDNQDDEIK